MDSPSVFWRVLVLVFLKVEGYQNFERLSQIFGFSKTAPSMGHITWKGVWVMRASTDIQLLSL